MSYFDVGLKTIKGTGSSGYIQKNLSLIKKLNGSAHIRKKKKKKKSDQKISDKKKYMIEHNKKKKIDIKCMELRLKLEDENEDETSIEKKINEFKKSYLFKIETCNENKIKTEKNCYQTLKKNNGNIFEPKKNGNDLKNDFNNNNDGDFKKKTNFLQHMGLNY